MAGRPRKPKNLLILEGNPGHQTKKELSRATPKPDGRLPQCPGHLTGEARKEWKRVTRDLRKIGILDSVDRVAIASYCDCYRRWREASDQLTEQGLIYKQRGIPKLNPLANHLNGLFKELRQYLTQFGMTPAAREKITVKKNEESVDPMDQILGKKAG